MMMMEKGAEANLTKVAIDCIGGVQKKNPGDVLLSHAVARIVPSTLKGLTSVFGMGTGVAPSPKSPGTRIGRRAAGKGARPPKLANMDN
jgi:hypothetical protein